VEKRLKNFPSKSALLLPTVQSLGDALYKLYRLYLRSLWFDPLSFSNCHENNEKKNFYKIFWMFERRMPTKTLIFAKGKPSLLKIKVFND
jgi:hypothetical protein